MACCTWMDVCAPCSIPRQPLLVALRSKRTLVTHHQAVVDADEWARIYKYQYQLGQLEGMPIVC